MQSNNKPRKNARKRAARKAAAAPQRSVGVIQPNQGGNTKGMETTRVSGKDLIAFVGFAQVGSTGGGGVVLYNALVTDSMFVNTRVGRLFSMFDKYRFKKLVFHVIPGVPSTASSFRYGITYDLDPSDATPPNTSEGIQQLAAQENYKASPGCEPLTLKCDVAKDWLYTNNATNAGSVSDPRLYAQGQIYISQTGTAPVGVPYSADVYVEYDVEFAVRNFDPIPSPSQQATAIPVTTTTAGPTMSNATVLRPLDPAFAVPANITTYVDGLDIFKTVGPAPGFPGSSAFFFPKGNYEVDVEGNGWSSAATGNVVPIVLNPPGTRQPAQASIGAEVSAIAMNQLTSTLSKWSTRVVLRVADAAGAYLGFGLTALAAVTFGQTALAIRRIPGSQ